MRAHQFDGHTCAARGRAASPSGTPADARAAAPNPPRRSACGIWCGWRASPRPPSRPTASASPTRCAPRTWTRTRAARRSGRSRRASATPRRCGSPTSRRIRTRPNGPATAGFSITSRIAAARARSGASRPAAIRSRSPPCRSTWARSTSSPKSDRVLVTVEVFTDCATLACTKERLDAAAHAPRARGAVRQAFRRHWDTWSDGRRSQLFSIALDASGAAGRHAGQSHRGHRRRRAEQALRRPRGLRDQRGRAAGGFFGARRARGRALVHQFRHLHRTRRAAARRAISPPTIPPRTSSPPSLPTARGSPISRASGPDSNRTGCIWCSSI